MPQFLWGCGITQHHVIAQKVKESSAGSAASSCQGAVDGQRPLISVLGVPGAVQAVGETLILTRHLGGFSWPLFFWRCGGSCSFPCWSQGCCLCWEKPPWVPLNHARFPWKPTLMLYRYRTERGWLRGILPKSCSFPSLPYGYTVKRLLPFPLANLFILTPFSRKE